MRLRPLPTTAAACVAAAVLCVPACTAGGGAGPTPVQPPPVAADAATAVGAAATTSRAAELRAGLSALLTERAHLVALLGAAVRSAEGRLGGADVRGVRAALDDNSLALVDVLGRAGSDGATGLLAPLRRTDALLAEHAAGGGRNLDLAAAELGTALAKAVPRLEAGPTTERVVVGTLVLRDVLDAEDSRRSALLREAADVSQDLARAVASAIAAEQELGTVSRPAAQLRARLTGLLTGHVMLTGALARSLADARGDLSAAGPAAAVVALDAQAVALADALGAADPAAAAPFLASWRGHVASLSAYAAATAAGDAPAARRAATALTGYPDELGRVVQAVVPDLPAAKLAEELGPYASSVQVAVDASAAVRPDRAQALRRAAADLPAPAALVAAAVAEDNALR